MKKDGKWGYIDPTGKEVVPCQYDGAGSFSDGLAHVKKDGKWGLIDPNGKEAIPCEYDSAAYGEGYFVLIKDEYLTIWDKDLNRVF